MGMICPKCKYKEVEEFEDKTMMFSKIYECLNCHYLFTIEDTEFRQKEYYPELLEELK